MSDSAAVAAHVDDKVQSLAAQALDVTQKNAGTIAKVSAVVLIALWGFYMKYQLNKRNAQLAAAQASLDNQKLDAQKVIINNQSAELSNAAAAQIVNAQLALQNVATQQQALDKAKQDHADRVARVQKLSDWKDLNQLAGVA